MKKVRRPTASHLSHRALYTGVALILILGTGLWLWALYYRPEIRTLGDASQLSHITSTTAGQLLAIRSQGTGQDLVTVDASSGTISVLTSLGPRALAIVDMLPSGKDSRNVVLGVVAEDGTPYAVSGSAPNTVGWWLKTETTDWQRIGQDFLAASWHPDGQRILVQKPAADGSHQSSLAEIDVQSLRSTELGVLPIMNSVQFEWFDHTKVDLLPEPGGEGGIAGRYSFDLQSKELTELRTPNPYIWSSRSPDRRALVALNSQNETVLIDGDEPDAPARVLLSEPLLVEPIWTQGGEVLGITREGRIWITDQKKRLRYLDRIPSGAEQTRLLGMAGSQVLLVVDNTIVSIDLKRSLV